MISGYLVGDKALIARFSDFPEKAKPDIDATTMRLGFQLERDVVANYLSGQIFRRVTGRLASSITHGSADSRSRFEGDTTKSVYYVGTNVEYAAPLFYGTKAYDIRPVKAKALHFMINGEDVFAKIVHMPARPGKDVLDMALQALEPRLISEYTKTLESCAKKYLHGNA